VNCKYTLRSFVVVNNGRLLGQSVREQVLNDFFYDNDDHAIDVVTDTVWHLESSWKFNARQSRCCCSYKTAVLPICTGNNKTCKKVVSITFDHI